MGEEEGAARRLDEDKDDGEDEGEAADAEDGRWCMGRMLVGLWGVVLRVGWCGWLRWLGSKAS